MNRKELILSLCFTESSLRYKVTHSIKTVVGICGIDKRYWSDLLKKNDVNINSLKAGEVIYDYLLDKNKGNKYRTLLEYKGVITQTHLVDRVLKLEKKLKENK